MTTYIAAIRLWGILKKHCAITNFTQRCLFNEKDNESRKYAEKLQTEYETKEKEKEVERLQELEVLKTRFFTQITHELRTPLTLIQGPAQQILRQQRSFQNPHTSPNHSTEMPTGSSTSSINYWISAR